MKVYLSKSNLSDPYLVDRVRDSLLTGGYTVHEHYGGNIYNPEHMLECQAMIMVPSKTAISVESRTLNTKGLGGIYGVHLGKGQMMQFLDFQRHIKTIYSGIKRVPIFVVEEVGDSNIYVSYYHDYELENNPDWKVRFGLVYLEGNCDNMINTLNTAKAAWEIAYPEDSVELSAGKAFAEKADVILNMERPSRPEDCFKKDNITPHLACRRLFNR